MLRLQTRPAVFAVAERRLDGAMRLASSPVANLDYGSSASSSSFSLPPSNQDPELQATSSVVAAVVTTQAPG